MGECRIMGFLLAGKDMAGGLILPDISPLNVLIEGFPVAVLGSSVVPHGSWKTPHGHYQKMVIFPKVPRPNDVFSSSAYPLKDLVQ